MVPTAGPLLAVMAMLLTKHFLFDFVLQTAVQLRSKVHYGHPAGLLHAGLHAAGSVPALLVIGPSPVGLAAIVVGEFVIHYHVDWGKEQLLRRKGWGYVDGRYWAVFGADQLAHGLTYVAMALALAEGA